MPAEVDEPFAALLKLDDALASHLGTSLTLHRLHRQWMELRERNAGLSPPESFAEHTALVGGLADFMDEVADHAGPVRDSDMATTHGVAILIQGFPWLGEYLGHTRGRAVGITAAGQFTRELFTKLSIKADHAAISQATLAKIATDLKKKAPELAAILQTPLDGMSQKFDRFIGLLNSKMLTSRGIQVDSNTVFASGTMAIGAAFALYDTVQPALQRHLAVRAAAERARSWNVLPIGVRTLALLVYFAIGFYRVVTRIIRPLSAGTRQTAVDLTTRVELEETGELLQVVQSINCMAENFGRLMSGAQHAGEEAHAAIVKMGTRTTGTRESRDLQQVQISQVATKVNEMNATVPEVAQSAVHAAEGTREARNRVGWQHIVGEGKASIGTLAQKVTR